jgi:hypothetical protein
VFKCCVCPDTNRNWLTRTTRSYYLKGKKFKISILFTENLYSLSKYFHTEDGGCILLRHNYMMSHSIIAFSRFFNATSKVLALIIMKILSSWEVMQYDPVEIYTVWRNVFLPSSKRKKIYTRPRSVKTQKKEIFVTYRVAVNLRHSSLCDTP